MLAFARLFDRRRTKIRLLIMEFLACLLISLLAYQVFSQPADSLDETEIVHSIKKGETLSDLAIFYYGKVRFTKLLAEYNNITDVYRIPVGREIKIPRVMEYKIKPGDTLSEISQRVLGTWKKYRIIAEYNGIANPNYILAGARLKIPLMPPSQIPVPEKEKPLPEVEKPKETKPEVTEIKEEPPKPVHEEIPPKEEEVAQEPIKEETPPAPIEIPEPEKEITVEEKEPEIPIEKAPEEPAEPVSPPVEEEQVIPKIPPPTPDLILREVKPEEPQIVEKPPVVKPTPEIAPKWPYEEHLLKPSPWKSKEEEEKITEPDRLSAILGILERMDRVEKGLPPGMKGMDERGVKLPMQSLLQVNGYKSIAIQYNKTHYFGKSDINRYKGYYSGGYDSGYYDYGMDYGSYGYSSYDSYGSGSYGSSGYSSYGSSMYGYGGYGMGRREGPNIEQEFDIHIHGRVGLHTHVAVDYNDSGRSQFGGMGQKEQKIAVWYEGDPDSIIQRAAFGDIMLSLPNSRFLNMSRNLFGANVVAKLGDVKLTAFGTRTKGIKETWTSRGQSRRAGGGIGNRIMDLNYIKERYYAINVDEDGLINDSYLPIEPGSEQIYIDDGIGTNNDSGISTAKGYFDYQYPGDDYNIDYTTGRIEFIKNISTNYKIVAAYRYRGNGGGVMGNPDAIFKDDDGDGVIDNDPSDPIGYVAIKGTGEHGSELRNVYSLGNRNISRRDFNISIWREGGTDSFKTDAGTVSYARIFGLDSDGDGLVDPELVDFEKGLLFFRSYRPFVITDPQSPYYKYGNDLNNEAIYSDNPRYTDQKYVIQADYSYQTPSFYLGRLNILPDSETVKVNGRKLKSGTDYMIIYEVGSVEIFMELDEYDDIVIEYEYMPFGGQFQQTIAGLWAEYSYRPKPKSQPEKPKTPAKKDENLYESPETMSPFSQSADVRSSYGYGQDSYGVPSSMYGGSSYDYGGGSSYYDDYSSYGGYSGRRGSYGSSYGSYSSSYGRSGFGSTRRTPSMGMDYGASSVEGLNLTMGYIYNTGQRSADIPDVNSAPSRLQALVLGGNWGQRFDLAPFFGLFPFVTLKGIVPLSISLSGEAAYSRNNPNSVGYAMIDGMEGAKDSSRLPTYKFSWKLGGVPVDSITGDVGVDTRAIFHIAPKDKDASYGNYMKNRETSASEINPLSRATQRNTVMEIGYELDEMKTWGGLTYPLSGTGADYSQYEFLEIWMKVSGDDKLALHIDFGLVSEDADEDFRLDSEDLPNDLVDRNGDHKIDVLDLDKENLPEEHRYKGNGSLDIREDTGWAYNDSKGNIIDIVGKDNGILDSEDLDGDLVLDLTNSYLSFTIPLDSIPTEWISKKTNEAGWVFLSIPIESAKPKGMSPTWGVIKHARIWLEKTVPGNVSGKFQWYSIAMTGNRWERGIVVENTGKISGDKTDQLLVGIKNNQEFDDYLSAYKEIENDKEFKNLHPYVESAFTYEDDRLEQSLTLNYRLQPESTGFTMRRLSGQLRGNGQDFSKHRNIRLWLYGDGSKTKFIMRFGSNVDDFGAGTLVKLEPETDYTGYGSSYNPYSYSYSSMYSGSGYYEYTQVIDFTGWRLIAIPLEDADEDGQPDGLKAVNNPVITNISQILVGLKNDSEFPMNGEIWVNAIHLSEPYVRSGWARRFNFSTDFMGIYILRAGYSKQDQEFENSAGQTSRSSMMSMGYSASNYDYNLDNELRIISWLPISFNISHRETESRREYGMISSYGSGLTKTDNKTISTSFSKGSLPNVSLSYDRQREWNEYRGLVISDLYSSNLGYSIGKVISANLNYSHEFASVEKEESATTEYTSSSYYYYGRDTDAITDSGGISLQITPVSSFSLNPTYDVRRELRREPTTGDETKEPFSISSREQRFSLRPTLRKFFGLRPSLGARFGFSEDWFRGTKDSSLNSDFNIGFNLSFKDWFARSKSAKAGKDKDSLEGNDLMEEEFDNVDGLMNEEDLREMMDQRLQDERGNWIEGDKNTLRKKLDRKSKEEPAKKKGILTRSLESFTFNTDFRFDVNDYLRELEPGMGFFEIIKLDPESKYRSRSSNSKRLNIRSDVDPLSWMSVGANMSFTNRFTKSLGTAANSNTATLGGNLKFFDQKNTTSLMLKYDLTTQNSGNASGGISDSISHNQSVMVRKNWSSGVGSSFGVRTTLRSYERGGVETKSTIVAPNFNIDYKLHVKGEMGVPLIRRKINLDHNLDMSNTFSSVIRREKLGVNRDEKSEQYGTSLDVSYNLRQGIRATLRVSVDYNHDRVEEGADYLTFSGSMMLRGEIK